MFSVAIAKRGHFNKRLLGIWSQIQGYCKLLHTLWVDGLPKHVSTIWYGWRPLLVSCWPTLSWSIVPLCLSCWTQEFVAQAALSWHLQDVTCSIQVSVLSPGWSPPQRILDLREVAPTGKTTTWLGTEEFEAVNHMRLMQVSDSSVGWRSMPL